MTDICFKRAQNKLLILKVPSQCPFVFYEEHKNKYKGLGSDELKTELRDTDNAE